MEKEDKKIPRAFIGYLVNETNNVSILSLFLVYMMVTSIFYLTSFIQFLISLKTFFIYMLSLLFEVVFFTVVIKQCKMLLFLQEDLPWSELLSTQQCHSGDLS